MKRKMAVILLLVCMAVAGCTAKGTGNEGDTEAAERMEDESAKSGVTDGEAGRDENAQQQRQAEPEAAVQEEDMEDSMLYRDAVLTREAPEDKVSILVQPSVLRTYGFGNLWIRCRPGENPGRDYRRAYRKPAGRLLTVINVLWPLRGDTCNGAMWMRRGILPNILRRLRSCATIYKSCYRKNWAILRLSLPISKISYRRDWTFAASLPAMSFTARQ